MSMRRIGCVGAIALSCAFGQTYTINTFAGGALPTIAPATSVGIGQTRVAVDAAGGVYIASLTLGVVFRLDPVAGTVTVVAGSGVGGFNGDNGPATNAGLVQPDGVAVDSAGNIYISTGSRVRRVTNGIITTVAGTGSSSSPLGDNGPATSGLLIGAAGLAVDAAGNLYIADLFGNRVRKVSKGIITTVAGDGTAGFGGDNGPATSAQLFEPNTVAVDAAGDLYIADANNFRVRKVSNGVITTVAGSGKSGSSGDNIPATSALVFAPRAVAVDMAGSLYIGEIDNRIRKVTNGIISTIAGTGKPGFGGDNGPATSAQMDYPDSIAIDATGNVYFSDTLNNRVRRVSNSIITTVAGNGTLQSGDSVQATSAQLAGPSGIAADSAGNVYIADSGSGRIRKVSQGVISTIVGSGTTGVVSSGGDNGPALSAQLATPSGIALDSAGNLYIAEAAASRIRKVSGGIISTVAGNATHGFGGDNGPATSAQLNAPTGVAIDSAGNLYIADSLNQRVRKVSNGVITTIAGNGTVGFSGDNGLATSAELHQPAGVSVDAVGNIYISDSVNARVRKIANGVISTVAGTGACCSGDGDGGLAINAQLIAPTGLSVDSAGALYIVDELDNRVRRVANGVISTVAGNGTHGFSGDNGPATSAQTNFALNLFAPAGVAVGPGGKIYFSDSSSSRVRLLTPLPSIQFSINAVTNAASNLPGAISPGEIVVITGVGLGPAELMSAGVSSAGVYGTELADTTIHFNGIPAPMIYTSAAQVAAIVPYGVNGPNAEVTATYQGQTTIPVAVAIASSAPGLFTSDSSGIGQAAVVNQDGSLNSGANPAQRGSIVSLFATGEGQTSPTGVDGKPATTPLPTPTLPVSVTIGGQTINGSQLQYVGGAPGLVAGLLQINVQIPSGIQAGSAVPASVQIGNRSSQAGVTISVGN